MGFSFRILQMAADDSTTAPTVDATETTNDQDQIDDPTFGRKVFVGNMSFKTNFKSLKEAFSVAGTVEKVNVISRNGRRLGFGFVQFETEEGAQAAVEKMNAVDLDGREIKVELSRSTKRQRKKRPAAKKEKAKAAPPPKKKKPRRVRVRVPLEEREESEDVVYVRNIGEDVTEELLENLCKDFGVTGVTIRNSYRRKDGERPRFAFITVDPSKQQAAVDFLEGREIEGNTVEARKAFKMIVYPDPEPEPEEAQAEEAAVEAQETAKPKRKRKPRRKPKTEGSESSPAKEGEAAEGSEAKPKRRRPRKPKVKKQVGEKSDSAETSAPAASE